MKRILWATGIFILLVLAGFGGYSFFGNQTIEISIPEDRINYYYRHQKGDQLIPILESELRKKDLTKEGNQDSPFVHFFATAFHQSPGHLPALKAFENGYSGNGKAVIRNIIAHAENYRPAEFKSPNDLEFLWVEFQATGNQAVIAGIIKGIESSAKPQKSHFLEAIRETIIQNIPFAGILLEWLWGEDRDEVEAFLVKKIPRHREIIEFLRKESEDENGLKKETVNRLLDWTMAAVINPAENHIVKGKNLVNLRKFKEALKEYETALSYFPDNSWAYMNIAIAYEYLREMDQAILFSKKAIEMEPENATAAYNLGRNYFDIKQYDAAVQAYLKALEYYPDHPSVNHALARAYQMKGEKENAVLYFKKYLEYAPDGEHVPLVKGYLASVGHPVAENPNDVFWLLKKKQYEALEKVLGSLLRKRENNEDGFSLLFLAYKKICMNPDAKFASSQWIQTFENWLKHNPESHFANACTGVFYIGHAWNARGSGWASTVTNEGSRLFSERLSTAQRYLEKAYQLDPSDPIVPARLIDVARGLGLGYEEMEKQFQRALQADKSEYQAYHSKLTYLMPKWQGMTVEAEERMFDYAREAAQFSPPNSLIPLVLAEAHWEMYYRSGHKKAYFRNPEVWEETKKVYLSLAKRFPQSRKIHNWFAMTAYLAGDQAIAKKELEIIKGDWLEEAWGDRKYFEAARKEMLGS